MVVHPLTLFSRKFWCRSTAVLMGEMFYVNEKHLIIRSRTRCVISLPTGHCPRGALCFFIHGQANASSLPGPVMKPVQPVMCKSILETGRCQRIFQGKPNVSKSFSFE